MKLIVRFLPLVVFTVLSSAVSWRLGVFAALLAVLAQVAFTAPHRFGVLSAGMATFFAGASVVALVAPHADLAIDLHPAAAAWMALVSGLSIAFGRPFTLDVASEGQPPEVLSSPTFLAINEGITARWAWTFLAIAAVSSLGVVTDRSTLATAFTVIALLAAARFSTTYPERVLAARATQPA